MPLSEIDDMEEYLEKLQFILKNLGIINLDVSDYSDESKIESEKIFYLPLTKDRIDENNNILTAKMIIINDGYRLLPGSYIEKEERSSFSKHVYYPLCKKYETSAFFGESKYNGCNILKKEIDFSSPSAAASVVKNRATNGPKEWRLKNENTLDEYLTNMNPEEH